jgi:hypothetical protein
VCKDGYAKSADQTCLSCSSSNSILLPIAFALFIVIAILCYWQRNTLIRKLAELEHYFLEVEGKYDLKSYKNKAKILMAFFQILSSMPVTLALAYPTPYADLLDFLSFSNIDLSGLFNLGCLFESNFYTRLRCASFRRATPRLCAI